MTSLNTQLSYSSPSLPSLTNYSPLPPIIPFLCTVLPLPLFTSRLAFHQPSIHSISFLPQCVSVPVICHNRDHVKRTRLREPAAPWLKVEGGKDIPDSTPLYAEGHGCRWMPRFEVLLRVWCMNTCVPVPRCDWLGSDEAIHSS